jgi:hypothetical protein
VLTSSQVVTIESDVRTFGEFKVLPEIEDLGIDWKNCKLIDRATKATFELDDAVLPAVNCILFQTITKSKAGMDWTEASYSECKEEMKCLKEEGVKIPFNYTHASTDTLREFLSDYYEEDFDVEITEKDSIETIISTIENLLSILKVKVNSMLDLEDFDNIVDFVTVDDLEDEFEEIQQQLKK